MAKMQLHEDIKEINLSYMLLARQMIEQDKESAMFRLGLSEQIADMIAGLSPAQMLRMSASNMLLCSFRFDERMLTNLITDIDKDRLMPHAHTTIMMAARRPEAEAVLA